MITGEIKNKLDRLWDAMWSNQMTNASFYKVRQSYFPHQRNYLL